MATTPTPTSNCNGICLTAYDIGLTGGQIAYAHPECPEHGNLAAHLTLTGHPATQGSKKGFKRGKKIVLVEMDPKLPAWRNTIKEAAQQQLGPAWVPLNGPLWAEANFYLPRPKTSSFGDYPAGPPDLDKLQRALGDALTLAKAIHDDARIVKWEASKHWATEQNPVGATVIIRSAP